MMQKPIAVMTEIRSEEIAALENYLGSIGADIKNNTEIQFSRLDALHYCSWIIIKDNDARTEAGELHSTPVLLFEANIDGDAEDFLKTMVANFPAFMENIYRRCVGYQNLEQLVPLLMENDHGATAFYNGHPAQTRKMIEFQSKMRGHIEDYIDQQRGTLIEQSPAEIHQKILAHLNQRIPGFSENKPLPPPWWIRLGRWVNSHLTPLLISLAIVLIYLILKCFGIAVLAGVIGGVVAFIAAYLIWLRRREKLDQHDERSEWKSPDKLALQEIEDRQQQNHLTSVTYVKAGFLRLWTIKLVLFFVNIAARFFATEGALSGIVTIHFARWIVLPGKEKKRARLIFLSNYDGSWENYLGEFVDHASLGLSAVWSNTENGKHRGFPNTKWLGLSGGSRNEQAFKIYARNSQRRELIWYSAYPNISVKNISNNKKIHEGLYSDEGLASWLNRL